LAKGTDQTRSDRVGAVEGSAMTRINISVLGDHDDEGKRQLLEAATKAVEEMTPVYRAWVVDGDWSSGRYGNELPPPEPIHPDDAGVEPPPGEPVRLSVDDFRRA
jgi:hypothetical protein